MTTIVTLLRSNRLNTELRTALRHGLDARGRISLVCVANWSAVEETLAQRPVAAVVFDLSHPGLGSMERVVGSIEGHPVTEFVLYVGGFGRVSPQDIVEVARAGVRHSLSPVGDDGETRFRDVLDEAIASAADERLLQTLATRLEPGQLEILRLIMRHTPGVARVQDLAGRLNMSTRTLERYASDEGLPPPSHLLSWIHLYHVTRRVLVDGATVNRAIRGTAFSSAFAFRRALQRVTGRTLTDLRHLSGPGPLARAFAAAFSRGPIQLALGLPSTVDPGTSSVHSSGFRS